MNKKREILFLHRDEVKSKVRKMKLTAILLFIVCISFGNSFSQVRLSVQFEKADVREAIQTIEEKTNYIFLYKDEIFDFSKKVSGDFKNAKFEDVLKDFCDQTNVSYEVRDRQIILKEKDKNLTLPLLQQPEKKDIAGTITDKNGLPIPGVSVVVKGTTTSAITDSNGQFELTVSTDAKILRFSFVGMKSEEIPIENKTIFSISLEEETVGLDEVVVVGYGTMKKSDVNAAIVSVKSQDLEKSTAPSVIQMLTGKAAGLTVLGGSAQPGGNTGIFIRGAASTGAGNDPLYVIDGFPVINDAVTPGSGNQYNSGSQNPLNSLNPNDIESIEILKDASATAIYGARGCNGVILITTKRGEMGTHVEYNFNTSVQKIINQPQLLNASEWMTERNNFDYERFLMLRKAFPYGTKDPATLNFTSKYSDTDILNAGVGTNWYDLITQLGTINQHNLSIRGGNEKTKTLLSFNYFNQTGVIKTSGLKRYSLRYNLDQKIAKWCNIGISSSLSQVNEENATLGDGRDATAGIIESAMNYSPITKAQRDPLTGAWIEDPDQALLNHPLSYLDIQDHTTTKGLLLNAFTNIYLNKDLWVKLSGGLDIKNGQRQNYYPQTTKYGQAIGGDANINSSNRQDYLAEALLNYQKVFKEKHKLFALVGYSYNDMNGDGVYTRATGFTSDALSYYALQAGQQKPQVSSYFSKHILASYLTRMQYSYEDKYLFTFTGRVDGSDRFGANNRYAFFPSAAIAWRLVKEGFMKDVNCVSDMKLRLSIGQVGNENIPNDASSEYYAFQGRNYVFGGIDKLGVNLAKIGNPDLKWETTSEINLGVDYGFLKNRINGSIDIYSKQVADLLTYRALPINSVVPNIPWNVGKTQSKGLELSLKTINMTGSLYWETMLTYTMFKDNWLERDPKVILFPYQGDHDPIRAVYALVPDGIKQANEATPTMPSLKPGQEKYKDLNGLDENGKLTGIPDGKIDQADAIYMGTQDPKFTAGLSNTLRYKGFDLNVFFYASYGALKYPNTRIEHSVYGSYGIQQLTSNYNYLSEVQNRWSSKNMGSTMPNGEVNSYSYYGSPYWEDASYLRLKDLSLGYDFSNILGKNTIKSARLYISVQNLFTITNYSGLDPEVENSRAAYPQQRIYSLGFDFKF